MTATIADFNASVSLGDAGYAGGYWDQAVTHYQAAGMLGATELGPAIDSKTAGKTRDLTQKAWDSNGILAQIPGGADATEEGATTARNLIRQMQIWYTTANNYVKAGQPKDVNIPPPRQTSNILPPGNTPMPDPVPAKPPPQPPPPAPPPKPPPPTKIPDSGPPKLPPPKPPVNKPLFSKANGLVAGVGAALAAGVAVTAGWPLIVVAAAGAALGGLGSKYLLKQ